MISMIRVIARPCIVIGALAGFVPIAPSYGQTITYASSSGQDNSSCSGTSPCATIGAAWIAAGAGPSQIICLNGPVGRMGLGDFRDNVTIAFYCPGGSLAAYSFSGANYTLKIQHMILSDSGATTAIAVLGNGTVILDDCDFANHPSVALDFEPNGPLNLVIGNSRLSNSASGMLLKPAAGGSIHATFDHVTINRNTGGGIKIDTTNGPVTVDITDSVVSDNGGNGINAVGGASQNIVSIKNSIIAKNGVAGVQANGANAGVLIAMTLLDQNATGATSIVGGGHISTYSNNQIVGATGSGFNQTIGLQ